MMMNHKLYDHYKQKIILVGKDYKLQWNVFYRILIVDNFKVFVL